jgi:hypothetical protein
MLDPASFDDLEPERYNEDEYRNDAYGPHGDVYPSRADLILLSRNPFGEPPSGLPEQGPMISGTTGLFSLPRAAVVSR